MGDDLAVVNAARVSFDKESLPHPSGSLYEKDEKLIKYLADHHHWSPFAHCTVKFRFKAPIFVARQLVKHQVGLTWNEVSRRYVDSPPELYWPEKWRKKAENVKQGSSEEEFEDVKGNLRDAEYFAKVSLYLYIGLINDGVCPEQARMVLPLSTYCEWIWTGSLYAWSRVYNQRTHPGAQKETTEIVKMIDPTMKRLFPVSWEVLTKDGQ